jgi:hypothetical protein
MWGYQGWEDIEWWTCARAKKNMTTRHRWRPRCRIAHGWKKSESFVSQQCDILPCTFIFLFAWFIHLISFLPLLFTLFLLFFLTNIYIFYLSFLFFFLSFPYTYFSLYFPCLDIFSSLFKAFNSPLSCMYTIWILNKHHARDVAKLWK